MRQLTLLLLLLLALVGCGGAVGPDNAPVSDPNAPVSSDDPTPTAEPAASPSGEIIVGEATVESIDIRILESFPVQVHVGVRGTLGDGCTELGEITQRLEGNTFFVTLPTLRPAQGACTMILKGLDETVPLEVAGLPAGEYTVNVNGVIGTFTLSTDNGMPTEEGTSSLGCPVPAEGQALYEDPSGSFCFLYPDRFQMQAPGTMSGVSLVGPVLSEGPEPVAATLLVNTEPLAEGATLASTLDEMAANFAGVSLTRTPATIGGQPAEIVEGLPGRFGSRIAYIPHGQTLVVLTAYPVDAALPEAMPDLEAVWASATSTFTFLP